VAAGKRMFRSQTIVRHECIHTNVDDDMTDQIPEGLGRAEVEPSAVQVKDASPIRASLDLHHQPNVPSILRSKRLLPGTE
jgi:hypothetical protein